MALPLVLIGGVLKAAWWLAKTPFTKPLTTAAVGLAASFADQATGGHTAKLIADQTGYNLSPEGLADGVVTLATTGAEKAAGVATKAAEEQIKKLSTGDGSSLQLGIPAIAGILTFLSSAFGKEGSLAGGTVNAGIVLAIVYAVMHYATKNGWLESLGLSAKPEEQNKPASAPENQAFSLPAPVPAN